MSVRGGWWRRAASLLVTAAILFAGCRSLDQTGAGSSASIPTVSREFRAAWIATVSNIDWPSEPGLSPARQKEEMRAMLDRAVELHLNAVILQVRPAADALYDSPLEPWSEYLTGEMGRAPVPYYDPLAFAVHEAHQRGLELHAWFNPYRARHPSGTSPVSADHISKTDPDLVRQYGTHLWLDPGEPAAAEHTINVILDVVERYEIDGVHFDDYFYPYKAYVSEGSADFPDSASFARSRTDLSRDDWRRQNVDRLIESVYREIKARKAHVKFGISPFGIWRPGFPPGTGGFDAYSELYADSRKWLREGWVDYFTPQIYYRIAQHAQPYPLMLSWWMDQNMQNRHIWPGNFTNRVDGRWPQEEIPGQIYVTRAQKASGNVHFSMRIFMQNPDSLNEALLAGPYSAPALVPASPWLDDTPPGRPSVEIVHGDQATTLELTAPPGEPVWLWVVRTRYDGEWSIRIVPGHERSVWLDGGGPPPSIAAVSAVDRTGNEGPVAVVRPDSASPPER